MDDQSPWHSLIYSSGIRIAVIGVLAILALFLVAETMATAANLGRASSPATDTITVQGEGEATMPPDVARISFTVENTAATVSGAQAETTKQANAALDFVKQQGVAEKDTRTLSYDISPQYSYPNPRPCTNEFCPAYVDSAPKITGYRVAQTIEVTVRDLSAVGELIEGLGGLEVQNVNGPAFALDDSTAGYDAARADAIAKAQAQAKILARALGVKLGKIVTFSESSGGYPPPYPYAYGMGGGEAMDKAALAAPELPAGENTYYASVSITYEIR